MRIERDETATFSKRSTIYYTTKGASGFDGALDKEQYIVVRKMIKPGDMVVWQEADILLQGQHFIRDGADMLIEALEAAKIEASWLDKEYPPHTKLFAE